jgi:hypothetical protein
MTPPSLAFPEILTIVAFGYFRDKARPTDTGGAVRVQIFRRPFGDKFHGKAGRTIRLVVVRGPAKHDVSATR